MRIRVVALMCVAGVAAGALSGCARREDPELRERMERLQELEQRIQELEEEKGAEPAPPAE